MRSLQDGWPDHHSRIQLSAQLSRLRAPQVCEDKDKSCLAWAEKGECDENTEGMLHLCPQSCGQCHQAPSSSPHFLPLPQNPPLAPIPLPSQLEKFYHVAINGEAPPKDEV